MTFAFILTRWAGDGLLAVRALESLRRHHPDAEVMLIVDGPLPPGDTWGLDLATTVLPGEALFGAGHGGAWLLRWLRAGLECSSADILVRLDTDALLTRPLSVVPEGDVFGTLEGDFVQGGVIGLRRAAALRLVDSGVLEGAAMLEHCYINPRSGRRCIADDRQLAQGARILGLTLRGWEEVCSRWQPAFAERACSEQYAAWHPVALERQAPPSGPARSAFIVTTHAGDWALAMRLLVQLLEHHKRAERLVIVDGPLPQSKIRALEGVATGVVQGEALGKDHRRPTAWLERLLRVTLERTSSEVIVKLDPDAYLTRAIRSYPGADLFGSGLPAGSVQGGCYGFRRRAAVAILESDILSSPELQLTNRSSPNEVWEDEQITRAARVLGLRVEGWGEVCSRFRPEFQRRDLNTSRAVWHPVKSL